MPVFFAAVNETATLSTTFTVNGVATDPTTVTLIVTDPLGASTSYTYAATQVTRASAGAFWKEVSTPTAGTWSFQWVGTGTVSDVDAGTFDVFGTDLGHLYATPGQLKSRLGIPSTDTSSDVELQQACRAASRAIEQYTGRIFWRGPAGEVRLFQPETWRPMTASPFAYEPFYAWTIELGEFNDLLSVTALGSDLDGDGVFETPWAAGSYELNPVNTASAPEPRPYTSIRAIGSALPWFWSSTPWPTRLNRLQVTGTFGWPAVPAAVSEACRILAAELFRAKDAPFGVASFGDAGVARVQQNPMVAQLAGPYRHDSRLAVFA